MEVRNVNGLRQCDAACVDTLIHIKQLQTFSQQAPSKQTDFQMVCWSIYYFYIIK